MHPCLIIYNGVIFLITKLSIPFGGAVPVSSSLSFFFYLFSRFYILSLYFFICMLLIFSASSFNVGWYQTKHCTRLFSEYFRNFCPRQWKVLAQAVGIFLCPCFLSLSSQELHNVSYIHNLVFSLTAFFFLLLLVVSLSSCCGCSSCFLYCLLLLYCHCCMFWLLLLLCHHWFFLFCCYFWLVLVYLFFFLIIYCRWVLSDFVC